MAVRDPALAVAISKCWLRDKHPLFFRHHPHPCRFCESPRDRILEALDEFRHWSMREGADAVRAFQMLPPYDQWVRVTKAQGYRITNNQISGTEVPHDTSGTSPTGPTGGPGLLGGRNPSRNSGGRWLGRTPEASRAPRGRVSDRDEEAPDPGDQPVPPGAEGTATDDERYGHQDHG